MATNVRSVDFLPEIFQTPINDQFLSATLDQLIQNPQFKQTQGFIGQRVGPGVNANDYYVVEPTPTRTDYQLEPGVVQIDSTDSHKVVDAITYPGINDALKLQGAYVDNANRLYTSDYYTWDPFVDFDKFVNYAQYYWLPGGPLAVDVYSGGVPLTDSFTVTRANGAYTFSGVTGTDPALTLVRGGSYTFNVAQNQAETADFRVTNNDTSSWNINYEPNPTLTLVRGNTYNFNLSQTFPWAFYFKTQPSLGTTNIYSDGVFNNGGGSGLITFTVPQDAPDTLYYCNDIQFNLRGQINIVDATPGTGPGFWIQTDPGVNGRIPSTPNISSRDVLGVTNNGADLGTITFDVPLATRQDFYFNMTSIGQVDLVTNLQFDQINNQLVSKFLADNPTGIDGITNLENRTLVFITQDPNPVTGGWQQNTFFDPLPNAGNVVSGSGSYDSITYSQGTVITDPATQYGIWRIQYLPAPNGDLYMSLQFVQAVSLDNKFSIGFGDQYSNTSWYKNELGFFSEIPLLTADKNLLYYQDGTDPQIFGAIRIIDQTSTTTIDVNTIIGAPTYTSPNGVVFSNGMKVVFRGTVIPASYENNEYYVEGVGTAIQLLPFSKFVTPETYTVGATIPYDTTTYDSGNFDGNLNQPFVPDYLTINRASPDLNAWTRSNRWFHIDVITASANYNNTAVVLNNNFRAKRPILEYRAGTRLFDFGTQGLAPVDIIDFTQTDALSTVSGSTGFGTDGYTLINGSTIIFAADADPNVRRTVYSVTFVTPDTVPPLIPEPIIVLTPIATALVDQTVVSLDGLTQQGVSYYYNGVNWIQAQQKISVNQPPLFDVYDSNGISFGDQVVYPSSNFKGSPLFSYAIGNGAPDLVLGFPLTYLSLTNIGDIVFDNNLYVDSFDYTINSAGQTVALSTGFVRQYSDRIAFAREIGWQTGVTSSLVRQQFQFTYDGTPLLLDVAVNTNKTVPAVQIYANGQFQEAYNYQYTVGTNTTTINLLTQYTPGDQIEVTVLSDQVSSQGFYEVPMNLSNNPLNGNSKSFTLGTIRNHYISIAENLIDLSGPAVGANNTRDLGNIVPYGLQILQQSSPLTLTGYFMRDANYDIFGALTYNSSEYIKFKSQLLNAVTTFGIAEYSNWTTAQLLDASIAQITAGRTNLNSFYWSDMLPTGTVFTSNSYTVTATTTNRFNTIQTYSFTESNYLGLCVYLNNVLLTREYDYVVSTEGPTLTITVQLNIGDVVTINEYADTAGNFVPNTPTKLGLYPKYEPKIFLDQDYVNPTPVIQGHDGSITVAFGDVRDQVLLEFEKRIFSNLKNDNNPVPLVAEDVIPGYFRTTDYTQEEINQILGESFLAWVGANKLDYAAQTYIADNEFTYNYSQAANRLDNVPLLGAWRGIYRWFYDTLTPNLTPWEMLGFSEQPIWWTDRYGPVPYTSDNLVLWGDLEQGLVADPVAPYVIPKYRRPGLTKVIPVDGQGQLLPPFYSVMGGYNPQAFVKSWTVGDGGPVEASWWSSSSYPFAVMRLLILTRPAEFFSLFADRDLYKYSAEFDQYLYNGRYRIQPQEIQVYGNGVSKASYIDWIVDYNQQLALNSTNALTADLANLDVRLCYRAASFIAKQNLELYLEKGAPQSQNDSLLIPPESYNLILYKNQPFDRINYSAVIIEVVENGYSVYGYSTVDPYFTTLASKVTGPTQTITGGNISVTVPSQYSTVNNQIPYGYTFTNLAGVVDFLLGYGQYLVSQGLTFTTRENGYTLNWIQMAQEFLYFANQGWAPGTIISLNPTANEVQAYRPGAVIDSIVTYTPENLLLDQNRKAFDARNLIVYRSGDTFQLNPEPGGTQTISYLQLQFTDYEDMVVLDNTTIFNDLIYDPTTAERQNRLKMIAATSTQWDGTLNAQGFILNQNNVVAWKSNTKYTKGDIVIYKNSYWQAANLVQPKAQFDYADWYKSNYDRIQQGLLQNLANKADQLANSYNTQTANLNGDNDLLAFGLIGFRPRQYMVDLNLSDPSQVQLYQQFIKTMGSRNATDLFTKVNFNNVTGQYNIYETWGIQVGEYGAQANRSWFEVALNEAVLNGNPSTFQIVLPGETSEANQAILLSDLWAESYAIPNTNILPTTYETNLETALPSAGYVNFNDVDVTVFNLNDPSSISASLSTIGNGTKIWVAQDNSYNWNIYQCAQVPGRIIQLTDNLNGTSIAQFSTTVTFSIGDLIIIRYFSSAVDGVYRVLSRPSNSSIVIQYAFVNSNQTTVTGTGIAFYLQTMRVNQASDVINLPYANQLIPGGQAWVDNNGSGHWEVLQKTNPFTPIESITPSSTTVTSLFGASVSQSANNYAMIVGAPGASSGAGIVYTYLLGLGNQYKENTQLLLTATGTAGYGNSVDFGNRTWAVAGASASNSGAGYATVLYLAPGTGDYLQTQLLVAPDQDFSAIGFGSAVKISADERWIYISAPNGNKIYAYGIVDVPEQHVNYTGNGKTVLFNYSNGIMINSSYPGQLLVTVNNTLQIYGVDYTLTGTAVQFTSAPVNGNQIVIRRRTSVELDSNTYEKVTQSSTTGSGTGSTFTVNNTRGTYLVSITAPGVNYNVGDQLIISYTKVAPTGSSANNLTITVTQVVSGGITAFTFTGTGVTNTTTFSLAQYLYTATNYYAFTVIVNNVLQRPYIDYTFSSGTLTFLTVPPAGAVINVQSGLAEAYWQYVSTITASGIASGAKLGTSLATDQLGEQLLAGAPYDAALDANGNSIANAGSVYAFDRNRYRYIINNISQLTYSIPGSYTDPVGVMLNGQYLTNTNQYVNGQFTVTGGNVVLSSSVALTLGDTLEIETNQFQFVEKFASNVVIDQSKFGQSLDICPNNCSVYAGAPLDSNATGVIQSGLVQRQVNQSRIYGVTTSTVANPSLTAGNTIRINLQQVAVPASPNNTVAGLVAAINASGIPNVVAATTPDVILAGDGTTKIFDIGNIYSSASAYTPIVYLDGVLQTLNSAYTYNNTAQQISFVTAPVRGSVIRVVAGSMTISVINTLAAEEYNKLTVQPGATGSAFADLGFVTYLYTQTIVSPNPTDYAQFGSSVNVNTGAINLVVGSPNGDVYEPTIFDAGQTYFDEHSTTFFGYIHNSGVVYTYDYLPSSNISVANPGNFVFGQQVYVDTLAPTDRFGAAVNYRNGTLVVGSPGGASVTGSISVVNNPGDAAVWQVQYTQLPFVDVNLISSVYSYDKTLNSTQTYFDYIDPLQGKILGVARRNIDYIGAVDPAGYNTGTVHNIGTSWGAEHLGEIWWDTNTVRFIDANQDNLTYASRRWGQIFPGSTIDIYQWTASTVAPAAYTGTGTPLSTVSYTVRSDINDQGIVTTTYYFWIKGITTTATQHGKTLSPTAIASYILDPSSSGLPYIAALTANAVAIYNAVNLLSSNNTILHVEYDREAPVSNSDIHTEFMFIADGKATDFLNNNLYRKLVDSFCGTTVTGAAVPDPTLSLGMQYGIQYRPRQSMFVDRFKALENYLIYANTVLAQYPISETRSFVLLNSSEPTPAANSGAWDFEVASLEILYYQNLSIVPLGYKYLVLSDSSQAGRWTIYEVAQGTLPGELVLNLVQVQSYDTPLYWNYINWYLPGYNSSVQPVATVANVAGLQTLSINTAPIGSSVKVTANGRGFWEIYLRIGDLDTTTDWKRVGLQDGTIAFSKVLWNYPSGGFGFDSQVFDALYFDQEPVVETRQIINAINQQLFIDDLLIYRNQGLMLMFQYIYSEFTNPSWLVKTSYIDVAHVVRGLYPYELYQPDNQTFVENYLTEVKPYHVQTLNFDLIYNGLDTFAGGLTDYDVPAYYDTALEAPQFVSPILTPYTDSGSVAQSFVSDAASNAQIWLEWPWSNWFNSYLLSVESVSVMNGGSGYTITPTVVVTGNCVVAAELTAVINSAGQVIGVNVINPGEGYSTTPTITFTDTDGSGAVATARMGNTLVRSIKTTVKYDRYQYASAIVEWEPNVFYTAGEQVRYSNQVWASNMAQSTDTFVVADWTHVPAGGPYTVNNVEYPALTGVDRTMGYYVPGPNMPGLSLPLLIDGVEYPGVQVTAPTFSQNTGFDVGNYDINPFDNISYDAEGRPTYDPSILDAAYSSSYLDPYLGMRPTDINVAGGGYIDTFSSYAPEELVPASEFDTMDFRVYTRPGADWLQRGHGFPSATVSYVLNDSSLVLSFAGVLPYPALILLSNQTQQTDLHLGSDYTVDYVAQTVTIIPDGNTQNGNVITISVYEIGGGNQLYKNIYNGADVGNSISVPVAYYQIDGTTPQIQEFVIFVNGQYLSNSNYSYEATGASYTTVIFDTSYTSTDSITLYVLAPTQISSTSTPINYSWSAPQQQLITATGALTYTLNNGLQYVNPDSLIVTVNGVRARTAAGARYTATSSATYALPGRLGFSQSIIVENQVHVYVNDVAQVLNVDFIVNPYVDSNTPMTIQFQNQPAVGAEILIYVLTNTQCYVNGNQLVFNAGSGLIPTAGSVIAATTWNDTRQQKILCQCFVGPITVGAVNVEAYDTTNFDVGTISNQPGSYDYSGGVSVTINDLDLGTVITDPSRLWVSVNGRRLFNNVGFTVSGTQIVLTSGILNPGDVVMISQFTNFVVPEPLAFRIFQDMRGVQSTYRITPDTTTTTTQTVFATDDVIFVANANALIEPNLTDNIWGAVTIDAERIMYRYRDTTANTISGLLRGTAGTAIAEHANGATVYNIGLGNLLDGDYQDYVVSDSVLGDGTTTTFTAADVNLTTESNTLQYDALQVFVGGTAQAEHFIGDGSTNQFALTGAVILTTPVVTINGVMQASGYTINYTPTAVTLVFNVAPASEAVIVVSTYTLNSVAPASITFVTAPPAGAEVLMLVQRGRSWYQPGVGTASDGNPLQITQTAAARFLRGQ